MGRLNGSGDRHQPERGAFQELERLILSLTTAKTKAEMGARLSGAMRLSKSIEAAMIQSLGRTAYLTRLIVELTGGRLIQLTMPGNLDMAQVTSLSFADAGGSLVVMIDPARLLILLLADHVQPLTCVLTKSDGTTESHELPPIPPVEPQAAATPPEPSPDGAAPAPRDEEPG